MLFEPFELFELSERENNFYPLISVF